MIYANGDGMDAAAAISKWPYDGCMEAPDKGKLSYAFDADQRKGPRTRTKFLEPNAFMDDRLTGIFVCSPDMLILKSRNVICQISTPSRPCVR
jgi:hypothetical protein